MKFSICIPTLNEENYISGILNCLKSQTYKDFEVIISDGKSEDGTKNTAERFMAFFPLKYLESPKRGVSFQRNYAAKHANNDLLIFFDADVFIENNFLESISVLFKVKNPDSMSSWVKPFSGNLFDKLAFFVYNLLFLETIKKTSPGAGGAFIYVKKKAFDKVGGFDESISYAEDFDFIKRLHKNKFSFKLLRNPKIWVSVRRFDSEGRVSMILKILKASFYYVFFGKNHIHKVQSKVKQEVGKF
jgi:glycosyltransferase involved in cell wall biosynthesis